MKESVCFLFPVDFRAEIFDASQDFVSRAREMAVACIACFGSRHLDSLFGLCAGSHRGELVVDEVFFVFELQEIEPVPFYDAYFFGLVCLFEDDHVQVVSEQVLLFDVQRSDQLVALQHYLLLVELFSCVDQVVRLFR